MHINRLVCCFIFVLTALTGVAVGRAAEPLRPWLHFGPVQVDVTKEYEHLQIYGLDRLGATLNDAQEADVRRPAATAPAEGAIDKIFGLAGSWELLRLTHPERLASWAKTGGTPMLWANAFQTTISAPERQVKLTLDVIGGVRVLLNGAPVYKANWPGGRYDVRHRHDIPLALKPGEEQFSGGALRHPLAHDERFLRRDFATGRGAGAQGECFPEDGRHPKIARLG